MSNQFPNKQSSILPKQPIIDPNLNQETNSIKLQSDLHTNHNDKISNKKIQNKNQQENKEQNQEYLYYPGHQIQQEQISEEGQENYEQKRYIIKDDNKKRKNINLFILVILVLVSSIVLVEISLEIIKGNVLKNQRNKIKLNEVLKSNNMQVNQYETIIKSQEKQTQTINNQDSLKLTTKQQQKEQNPNVIQQKQPLQKIVTKKAEHISSSTINSKLFKHSQLLNPAIKNQIQQSLKDTFYDIHNFLLDPYNCEHQKPLLLQKSQPVQQNDQYQQRPLLNITKTDRQLQQLIQKMKNHPKKPKTFPNIAPVRRVTKQNINLAYFFYSLNQQPNNTDYLQAQFYRYNKFYKIGSYSKQLPLCISLIGRNTLKYQNKLYQSIKRQNYTNYRIVHIDDNSNDGTQQRILNIIKQQPQFGKKITLVTQKYRRNALYNRNLGISQYCQNDSIILDMDADDWLIGNQVFQLVNTLYQTGNIFEGKNQQLWSLYFSHIVDSPYCKCILPNLAGQIPKYHFTQHTYRALGWWRTTHLRTFKKQLYMKIDKNDFKDQESLTGQFYFQSPDAFMHSAILELSGQKHMKILDQFLYFYATSLQNNNRRSRSLDIFYSSYSSQYLIPYQNLNSLNQTAKRVINYRRPQKTISNKRQWTKKIIDRRENIVEKIRQIIQKQKQNNPTVSKSPDTNNNN